MNTEGFKWKLSAILSADVAGYSCLMGESDDAIVLTLTGYREMMSTSFALWRAGSLITTLSLFLMMWRHI